MAYFDWSEDMSVNVKQIDDEHKQLIELINYLYSIVMTRDMVNLLEAEKTAITKMINYSAYHFATEEKFMRECQYEGYPEHKLEHDKFIAQARRYKTRLDDSGVILTLEIIDYLRDWLKKHTMGTDRKYTQCFNAHGLY